MTAAKIGKYHILRELGHGGMGVVYLAEDQTLRRKVAVKVLAPHAAQNRTMVNRFLTEAQAMAAMQHPHIVAVYEAGEDAGMPYFAMEYLEGDDLGRLIRRSGPIPYAQAIKILEAVASALDYAHAKGVIHRDIKPGNVLLTRGQAPKVSDFGIARIAGQSGHTVTGQLVGTPAYMAPELWNGGKPSPASDLYSLGILAYELLSGRQPFGGDTPMSVGFSHVNKTIPKLRMPDQDPKTQSRAQAVVSRMLAKKPADRFSSGEAFMRALAPEVAKPKGSSLAIPVGASGLGLIAVALFALWPRPVHSTPPPPPPPPPVKDPYVEYKAAEGDAEWLTQSLAPHFGDSDFPKKCRGDLDKMANDAKCLRSAIPDPSDPAQADKFHALGNYYAGVDHYFKFMHEMLNSNRGPQRMMNSNAMSQRAQEVKESEPAADSFEIYLGSVDAQTSRRNIDLFSTFAQALHKSNLDDQPGAKRFIDRCKKLGLVN